MKKSKELFGFKRQLAFGEMGEAIILEWDTRLKKHDGREYDFDRDDGKKVELKTDSYPIEKTPNFFIERYSVYEKAGVVLPPSQRKPGSLWQSLEKGVNVFMYMFLPKEGNKATVFTFESLRRMTTAVEKYLEENKPEPVLVRNSGYCALGYRVPRKILAKLYEEEVIELVDC
jgi:hypothetical protein